MKLSLPKEAKALIRKLEKAGFQAYTVGGSIRDILTGRKVDDWDFTTDATPEIIMKIFPDSFYDNKFGTVGIPIKEPGVRKVNIYEITTFRSESGHTDHRHPDKVTFGTTLEEDLKRRDFTINAMAYDGKKIIDLYDGRKDLTNKILKAVGDPNLRFREDALRMLRAIRIATELRFVIDENTFAAIKKNFSLLSEISTERIRDELLKLLSSDYPEDGIKLLRNSNLLSVILPELVECFGVPQKSPKRHHVYDVGTHLLMSLKHCPSTDPIVRLATLLHDAGKTVTYKKTDEGIITFYNHEIISASIARHFAYKYHLRKRDKERLVKLVRFHQFSVDERQTDSAIRRFIRNIGPENILNMLDLRIGDRLGGGARETSWRFELFKKRLIEVQKQPFTVADLKADGHDVMNIYNIGSGPLVGTVLNMLFNEVIEGKILNEKEVLLKRIKELKKKETIKPTGP